MQNLAIHHPVIERGVFLPKLINSLKDHLEKIEDLPYKEALAAFERNLIESSLKRTGSTHKTAKDLGISQPTVVRKAKALGIESW